MEDSNRSDAEASAAEHSIERKIGQRIHAFSNMTSGHYYGRSEVVFGVSLPEWRVLRSVLLHPEITQVEIATAEGLNVMNVSRAVAGLRRKTLVEARTDPADGRRNLLRATALGEEIGVEIAAREHLVYETVLRVLSADELELLDKLLDRVNTALLGIGLPDPVPPSKDWAGILAEIVNASDASND